MKKLIVLIAVVLIATSMAVAQEVTTAVLSMRERAEAVGGVFTIESKVGRGTRATVEVRR